MDDFSNHAELEHELLRFGLSRQEVKVYLCLLFSGSLLASTVARQVRINRSSVYGVLSSLAKRGFISCFDKNGVTYFTACRVSRFEDLCEERILQQRALQRRLSHFLSRFSGVKDAPADVRRKVYCFDGFEGVKSVYFDVISNKFPVYAFLNTPFPSSEWEFFYFQVFEKQRIERHVTLYSVVFGRENNNRIQFAQTVTAADWENLFPPCHLFVYGCRVAFIPFVMVEPGGFIFEDVYFSAAVCMSFKMIWKRYGGGDCP